MQGVYFLLNHSLPPHATLTTRIQPELVHLSECYKSVLLQSREVDQQHPLPSEAYVKYSLELQSVFDRVCLHTGDLVVTRDIVRRV